MSLALLVVTGTDVSEFSGIVTHFVTRKGGDFLFVLFDISIGLVIRKGLQYSKRVQRSIYSEIIAKGCDQIGTMCSSTGNVYLITQRLNDALASSRMARVSTVRKWTRPCRALSWIKSITVPMMLTVLLKADLRDMLFMGWMASCYLTVRKDLQTKFGPRMILKRLTVGLSIFHVILMSMCTLKFYFLNNAITSVPSKSNSFAFSTSAGKIIATSGSDTSKRSSDVALRFVESPVTVENAISGSSTPSFWLLAQLGHSVLFSDVSVGFHNEGYSPV